MISQVQGFISPYAHKKSICSPQCSDVDRNNHLQREMCIHECIHKFCFSQVYGDFYSVQILESRKNELLESEKRKIQFIKCFEGEYIPKSYEMTKLNCKKQCEFNTELDNQLCKYQCISAQCFFQVYEKFGAAYETAQQLPFSVKILLEKGEKAFQSCYEKLYGMHNQTQEYKRKQQIQNMVSLKDAQKQCKIWVKEKYYDPYQENPQVEDLVMQDLEIKECAQPKCFKYIYYDLLRIYSLFQSNSSYVAQEIAKREDLYTSCWERLKLWQYQYDQKFKQCEFDVLLNAQQATEYEIYKQTLNCIFMKCTQQIPKVGDNYNEKVKMVKYQDSYFKQCYFLDYLQKYDFFKKSSCWQSCKSSITCIYKCMNYKCFDGGDQDWFLDTQEVQKQDNFAYYHYTNEFLTCSQEDETLKKQIQMMVCENITNSETQKKCTNNQCQILIEDKFEESKVGELEESFLVIKNENAWQEESNAKKDEYQLYKFRNQFTEYTKYYLEVLCQYDNWHSNPSILASQCAQYACDPLFDGQQEINTLEYFYCIESCVDQRCTKQAYGDISKFKVNLIRDSKEVYNTCLLGSRKTEL